MIIKLKKTKNKPKDNPVTLNSEDIIEGFKRRK